MVRGDTRHYEQVADGCADGLMRVSLDYGMPVANGVLAVERIEDAEARAGGSHGNKGEEAALAAIEMAQPAGATAMSRQPHQRRDGIDPVARSRARRRALQAVYAWQMSGADASNVIAQFAHEQAHEVADLEYFEDLVRGVDQHRAELDDALQPFLDRDDRAGRPDRARRAAHRRLRTAPPPRRAVPRGASTRRIETVKRFGSEHGHTYVNGVLDHAAAAVARGRNPGAAQP